MEFRSLAYRKKQVYELGPRIDSGFIEQIVDMLLHRRKTYAKTVAYLRIAFAVRYELQDFEVNDIKEASEILASIAENRHALAKGGYPDVDKAALLLMDDFRSGRLGRISLEFPS